MISLSQAARKSIDETLIKYGPYTRFVIYPFGEGGKILKGILNYEYNIQETAIIDNYLALNNPVIKDISYLKNNHDVIVLISSYRTDNFIDIRQPIYEFVSLDRCVEVFSEYMLGNNYYVDLLRFTQVHCAYSDLVRVGDKRRGFVLADDLQKGRIYSFETIDGSDRDNQWISSYDFKIYRYNNVDAYSMLINAVIENNDANYVDDMILKIDMKGCECEFLAKVSSDRLAYFRQIVVVFYNVNTMDENKRNHILNSLSKLFSTHRVIHIHGNNEGNYISLYNHIFPDVWEVTYMRKDLVGGIKEPVSLPLGIDCPRCEYKKDLLLGNWNEPLVNDNNKTDLFEWFIKRYYGIKDKVYVIGDSHVGFFSGNDSEVFIYKNGIGVGKPCIDPFRTIHIGPALAYNLNKLGTNTKAREKIDYIINNDIIPYGSKIICVFGEIDIRVHVFKHVKNKGISYEDVIDKIIDNYIVFLRMLKKNYDVFIWCPVAQQSDNYAMDEKFPRCGTMVERNIATEYFINQLCSRCEEIAGIRCVSIFHSLIDEKYRTKLEFYKDKVHLSQKAWKLAEDKFEPLGITCKRNLICN
ncbi:hypothetical protein SAMN02910356_01170 [Selenomonas sp. GACV-9]|uniref:hypothetical protein n=1 Tax=Selenomonas sp. GACV-9 TaxID=3158782 RepID=UPI0008F426AB|nr:hypothetical protein SAMN02910356_01170 [Selenomonas ruminantium]